MMKTCVNRRRILIILFILSIGVLALLGISKYSFQKACLRREIRWSDLGIADDWQCEILTEAYKIKNEPNRTFTITASDGVQLVGHYYERKKNAPVIIFFHGLWSNCYTNSVPIYRITEEKEWNLLLVNLRAHNESGGDVSTLGVLERYDCRDWANWVASEFGEQVPIYLMGISMGGAIALMSSDLGLPKSVCGIIDDAGFTSPLEMIRVNSEDELHHNGILISLFTQFVNTGARIFGGFNLEDANSCNAVSKTNVPILIIHGDEDTQAPLSMANRIYESCQSQRMMYVIPGAGHTSCYRTNPKKYEMIVSDFIKRHIP